MLLGHIHALSTYQPLLGAPVWRDVLDWAASHGDIAVGEYDLFDGIRAIASSEQLVSRDKGVFEAHRAFIDLHYCIRAGEGIEWAPVSQLTPLMHFNTEKDYCTYATPDEASCVLLTPGSFALFFPGDAHMPKVVSGSFTQVLKIVFKIPVTLV